RPFGDFGPTVAPGSGRARLLTQRAGLSLSTERELGVERAHLQAVLDALPFLADSDAGDAGWLLGDPEQALAAVQQLPGLAAVAGLDWPRGKPVRVTTPVAGAMQFAVSSGRDWFSIDGELRLDESRVLGLQQLMQLARESRQGRFVTLGDGEYLALTERLRQQLADLDALAQADKQQLRLPAAAAAWLAETLDASQTRGDSPWVQRLARLDEAAALDPQLPAALQAELRSYQAEGYAWMVRLAHAGLGACLADDMGLGKTVQTLALLLARAHEGPALVIAPTSVCGNWVAEAQRFAPSLRTVLYGEGERAAALASAGAGDLVIASYALAQIDAEAFGCREWATLVLDEAQALKNAATKRAQSVATLQAGFRLALTGTPVENRLADLWSIMNLLNPGLLGSAAQFNERFAGAIERQRDDGARARLRRLVAPFLLRRTKAQVLTDLPPRTEIIHRVEPGPEERAFLEASRRSAVERVSALGTEGGDGQAAFHVLAELTRLRRAACDPRLVAPELGIVGAKAQEFEQLASELVAGRHKALVFSQFTDFLKLLAERLDSAGIRYQYLDGSTPAAERTRRVAAFQRGEGDLFLISLKAGGFGLNLTAADYVIIVDPWWNPAAEDQAMGRAHRIGQLRPVTVYRLVTAGSVEERIVALHRDKRVLADGILEGQDSAAPLRAADLRDLLGE
ncbi:MAG: DEAD/DEAH box helicase, partial [Rubrivivax sp.]|nr:DEAD/DEAH box helicase [Rubrivivax sp.]